MTDRKPGFQPGVSGNPAGKKPGTKNRATLAMEALLDGEAEGLTRKAIELAMEGDTTALRLCLERLCPPRKSRTVSVSLPPIGTASDVLTAFSSVLTAVSEGEITVDEAQALAGILETKRKAIESVDLEARIAKLEEAK